MILDNIGLALTGIRDIGDFQVFACEGRENQRDIECTSMLRPLRRQNPFAHEKKVGKKEYVSTRVLHRSTSRFGSEVNENI